MYRVLIVDDEVFVRNLLEKSLRNSGLALEVAATAGDGKEALMLALSLKPDIIITDIAMPFMNGLEFLQALQEQGGQAKTIIISGYDEFDYARTAIALGVTEYLLKPFSPKDLHDVFEKVIQELDNQKMLKQNLNLLLQQADAYRAAEQEKNLRALLTGEPVPQSALSDLGFSEAKNSTYVSCIIGLRGTGWDTHLPEQIEAFMNLIQSGYFSKTLGYRALRLGENKLVLCMHSEELRAPLFLQEVAEGLTRLSASMQQYYDVVPYAAIGSVHTRAEQLKESYENALKIWKDALNPEETIRIYGAVAEEEQAIGQPQVKEQIRATKSLVRGAVLGGKMEETMTLLQELMKLYAFMSKENSHYVLMSVSELVYGIAGDLEESGYARPETAELSALESGDHRYTSLLEIRDLLEAYLRSCVELVEADQSACRAKAAVQLTKRYVEEHLNEQFLSIEDAARTVHFSVSYLRQIFKEVVGESFGEYLIRRRMEKAGEYLCNTSMKVKDIAEKCGYENQRYFASSFKRFYGCTPTEYKEIVKTGR